MDVPDCDSCGHEMRGVLHASTEEVVAFYCTKCKRLRPRFAGTSVNDDPVDKKERSKTRTRRRPEE